MNDLQWEELDALCREVEPERDAAADERHAAFRAQLDALRPMNDLLDQRYHEMGIEDALVQVRDRLLGGAGIVQHTRFEYGLGRMVMLAWPSAADPRPDVANAAGECRVEVWLTLNEQMKPSVRVVGAKRLEALLPVAPDKLRGVLLSAVRSPAFTPMPHGDDSTAGDESRTTPAPEEDAPSAAGPDTAMAPDDTAPPLVERDAAGAPEAATDGTARDMRSATTQPPPPAAGDAPISMGPATMTDADGDDNHHPSPPPGGAQQS